ncbi:MAG: hypothetical protein HQL20_01330 [Candidatus Omnitrophica bacterium]|nr:hypothetical protein [Candidatus Omnitrophota bacterium]
MLKNIRNKKAQNTAEYAILIALVIGGVVAMQTYAQRALQARVRDTSRFMATKTSAGTGGVGGTEIGLGAQYATLQYEPYYTNTDEKVDKSSTAIQNKEQDLFTANGSTFTNKIEQIETTAAPTQVGRVEGEGVAP